MLPSSSPVRSATTSRLTDHAFDVGFHQDLQHRLGECAQEVAIIGPSEARPSVPFCRRSSGAPQAEVEVRKLHLSRMARWPPLPTPESPPLPWTLTWDAAPLSISDRLESHLPAPLSQAVDRRLLSTSQSGCSLLGLAAERARRNVSNQRHVGVLRHPTLADHAPHEHDGRSPRPIIRGGASPMPFGIYKVLITPASGSTIHGSWHNSGSFARLAVDRGARIGTLDDPALRLRKVRGDS